MHFSALITLLTAALASATPLTRHNVEVTGTLSKRSCFGSGEAWAQQRQIALDSARLACLTLGGNGKYNGHEQKSVCFTLDTDLKVDFRIKRVKDTSRTLGTDECVDGLQKEIAGCDRGGRTAYENWEYTSDPNRGSC